MADVLTAARSYRSLVLWFGLSYIAGIPMQIFGDTLLVIPAFLLWLAAHIVMLVFVYRVADAIGWLAPWL